MGDLRASSKEFWELIQEEVSAKYNEWLVASPLARSHQGGGSGSSEIPKNGSEGKLDVACIFAGCSSA